MGLGRVELPRAIRTFFDDRVGARYQPKSKSFNSEFGEIKCNSGYSSHKKFAKE